MVVTAGGFTVFEYICRWCDEDPSEILESVYTCIEKSVANLKKLNISPDSIKGR